MNRGRAKCERLKKIRKAAAERLHVDLHQRECTFEGDCKGTCPKCRQEEEILNRELLKRAAGLGIGTLAGLSLAGCAPFQTAGEASYYEETEGAPMERDVESGESDIPVYEELEGMVPAKEGSETPCEEEPADTDLPPEAGENTHSL